MSKLIRRKKEIGAALAVALQLTTLTLIGVIAHFTGGPQQSANAPAASQITADQTQTQNVQAPTVTDRSARRASAVRATKLYEPRATEILNLATSRVESAQRSVQGPEAPNEATLSTDREDYAPYSYVYISGTGFEPGETVNMIVVQLDPNPTSYEPWDVVADENGNIETTWYVFTEELIGATMQVTATGQSSLLTASATFTDNAAPVLYEDLARTIRRDAFAWGATVYLKGNLNGVSLNRCYKVDWVDPFGSVVQSSNFEPGTMDTMPSFVAPSGPSGVWQVRLYEADANGICSGAGFSTYPGSPIKTLNFDVARAVIIGAVPTGGVGGDNWVNEQVPGSVQTGDLQIESKTGQNKRIFVRFDLTGAGIAGTVNSALLRMQLVSAGSNFPRTHTADRVTTPAWLESTITWTNQPAFGAATDSQSAPRTPLPALIRWSVTTDVQGFINSSFVNNGWCIKDATEGATGNNNGSYKATEANTTTDKTQGPVLLVDYSAAASPTPSPSPSATPSPTPSPSPTPTATPGATNLTVVAAAGTYGGTVNLSATLTSGSGVSGKTISFTLNGNGVGSAVTNGSGVAMLNNVSLCSPPKINAGSYPSGVAGSFAGDTDYGAASGSNSLTVSQATLTITAATNTKPYDENTSAAATPTVSGLKCTDTVTGLSETYANKNVGTGKTLSVATGYTVNDGNSGNNYIVNTVPNNTGVITAVTLTITATTNSKPYDANTSAAAVPTVSGLQGTDTVTGLSETYDNKNVGTGKTLSVAAGYTVNDGNSGNNYNVSTVPNNTGVITAVTLTITAVHNSKPYDANTSAAAVPTVGGLQGTDTVTGLSETYDTKHVGTSKTLSVATYTVNDGNSGNNYSVSTVPNNTGVITAVNLTITAVTNTKPYDANTSAAATPTVSGLQGTDTVTGLSETYDNKNVGTNKALSVDAGYVVNDGNSGNNYNVSTVPNNTGVITAVTLTITAATNNKPYDANTTAAATPIVSGLQGTDTVTGLSETYDNKNVGTGKTLSVDAGYVVNDGNSGNNYNVSTVPNNTGVITAVTLTITAATNSKPYDANTTAAATPTVGGLQGTDTVTGLSEAYDNKNVGTGKTLSVVSYTVNDGNSGNNYNVSTVPDTTGVITVVNLTITATTNSKPYDANTSAATTPTVGGLQGTDTVTGLSETYDNKNVGTGKTLSVASYTVNDGNSGNNYNVSTVPDTTGVITVVNLTITAVTNTKPYDSNTSAAATPTVGGLQGTDTVTGLSEAYDNKNVGTGKTLSVASYTVNDGNSGNNYNVSTVPNTTGVITVVNLTITAVTNTKTYDCNTTASAVPTVSGLQGTDTVTGKVEAYATANAGTGKTLNVTAYMVNDGNGGNNYNVGTVPNNIGVINKANTTTSVTSSPNPSVIGQNVTFTATVAGNPPVTCTPGGTVTFKDGATTIGTGTLNGSGQATFSTSLLSAGNHSITAIYGSDGNFNASTSAAITQSVSYTFIGFLPPIDNIPVLNQVKAGQTIPVKWQLKDYAGNIICDLSTLAPNGLNSVGINCDSHDPIDDIEELVPPGGTVFRCDGTQFIFNWQTPKSWAGTCRQLQVTLADGHTYVANFKFK